MSGSSNPSDYQNKLKKGYVKVQKIKNRKKETINRASGISWTVIKYPILLTLEFQKEGRKKIK